MLVPEIWCRMRVDERDPQFLIAERLSGKGGRLRLRRPHVLASRLGYRITPLFVDRFLGRIFETRTRCFPEEMLRPEKQDLALFADGVDAIVEAQTRVALQLFRGRQRRCRLPAAEGAAAHHGARRLRGQDASTIPRVRAHVHPRSASWRATGTRSACATKQKRDIALWTRHVAADQHRRRDEPNSPESVHRSIWKNSGAPSAPTPSTANSRKALEFISGTGAN